MKAFIPIFLLSVTSVLSIVSVYRNPTRGRAALIFSGLLVVGIVIATAAGRNLFDSIRILSYMIFFVAPFYLLMCAFLLRANRGDAKAALVSSMVIAGIGVYAFWIEPFWLETSYVQVHSKRLTQPVRIVVLADIQTDRVGRYERAALLRAAQEKPSLILLPGDFIQERRSKRRAELFEQLREAFREAGLDRVAGVAVGGDHDPVEWPMLFDEFETVKFVETGSVDIGELHITALSLDDSANPILEINPSDKFHIVVGHRPDFALSAQLPAELLVAGHTHGGQVRLPFIGPLITYSAVPRSWAAGVTQLQESKTLSVSRGIGMERDLAPRLRFLCRPQIVVIDLIPAGVN